MLILAMESSAKPVSAAVYEIYNDLNDTAREVTDAKNNGISYGKLLGQYYQNNGYSHSRTLLVMVQSLLNSLDIKPDDLGLIAVANGHGSFTGIRIGVSAAKGLACGLDIPVCGVSTLEAMAYQAQIPDVILCPVMDARRSQIYNALFKWNAGSLHRLCNDRAISMEDLATELFSYDLPFLLTGDGVDVCKNFPLLKDCMAAPESIRFQSAFGVALAAAAAADRYIPASDLEPSYLRPSQAERMREF